jgi:hypothetical protein
MRKNYVTNLTLQDLHQQQMNIKADVEFKTAIKAMLTFSLRSKDPAV